MPENLDMIRSATTWGFEDIAYLVLKSLDVVEVHVNDIIETSHGTAYTTSTSSFIRTK